MQPGTWIIRLQPHATEADLQAIAAFLQQQLEGGQVVNHIDENAVSVLQNGTSLARQFSVALQVARSTSLQERHRYRTSLRENGAVASVVEEQGNTITANEIQTEQAWLASDDVYAMFTGSHGRAVTRQKRRLFGFVTTGLDLLPDRLRRSQALAGFAVCCP